VRVQGAQVVADGLVDGLAEAVQLGGGLLRGDEGGQLLGAVEEQLDAAQARLVWLELEAPFDLFGREGVGRVAGVAYFGGDFV
jgi:hypothetical protein